MTRRRKDALRVPWMINLSGWVSASHTEPCVGCASVPNTSGSSSNVPTTALQIDPLELLAPLGKKSWLRMERRRYLCVKVSSGSVLWPPGRNATYATIPRYVGRPPDQFAQRWHGMVSLSANHKSPCCLSQTGIRGHESHSDIARHSMCRRNALPLRSTIVKRQV